MLPIIYDLVIQTLYQVGSYELKMGFCFTRLGTIIIYIASYIASYIAN